MNALTLRRWCYRLAAVLGLSYVGYVVVMKLAHRVTTGPLGPVGEFVLVLASVTLFAVGLFADEALRHGQAAADPTDPQIPKETT